MRSISQILKISLMFWLVQQVFLGHCLLSMSIFLKNLFKHLEAQIVMVISLEVRISWIWVGIWLHSQYGNSGFTKMIFYKMWLSRASISNNLKFKWDIAGTTWGERRKWVLADCQAIAEPPVCLPVWVNDNLLILFASIPKSFLPIYSRGPQSSDRTMHTAC